MTAGDRERWVVFDLGETLVDESRNWAGWAKHLGVPELTFFAVMGAVIAEGRPHTDAFSYFRRGFSLAEERPRKAAAGRPWHLDADDLYEDALPALVALRAAGLRLAVMANQPVEAMPFLETLPVDAVAVSAEWGLEKPDPAFFRRICDVLDAPPEQIAYVGDRVDNDVVPAHDLGMTAVHLRRGPWGYLQAEWPGSAKADLRIDTLAGLLDGLRLLGFVDPPRMSEAVRETAQSYDRIVESYEAHSAQPPPERTAFLERFADRVRRRGLVLDAGCGPGHDLDAFSARGVTAVGLDSSIGMARRARSRGHLVLAADLRRPPVAAGTLDGLWSSASLLHVPRADVASTLEAWRRLLRPGGVLGLITSLGDDEGWEAVPYEPCSQHAGVPLRRWYVHHDRAALLRSLSEAGFRVEDAEERVGHRRWLQVLAIRTA